VVLELKRGTTPREPTVRPPEPVRPPDVLLPALLPPVALAEQRKLAGTWNVVSITRSDGGQNGTTQVPDKHLKYTFKGDKLIAQHDDQPPQEATIALNARTTPKQIDIVSKTVPMYGIYIVEGDTLKLCVGAPTGQPGERPSSFEPGPRQVAIVLKRQPTAE